MRHAAIGLACVLLHLSFVAAAAEPQAKHAYRYYLTGNAADVQRPSKGLLVLQGGGDDVDYNYEHMGKSGGGGDFVVLRASGDDEYNEYIYKLCHCDSVETLVVASRAQLAARMSNADAAT
ncbi:MAG TPA: hypothetical protein VL494_17925 [Steroidobacteraceae bacterium]|jgi:hypothetical protein|nr:hypothetical protein [Steroidobacteraceae bacterium]